MGGCDLIPQIWGAIWVELACARKFVKSSTHIRVNFYSGKCGMSSTVVTSRAVFANFSELLLHTDVGKVSVSS